MTTYTTSGAGHRILSRLEQGPGFFGQIKFSVGNTRRATKNAQHLVARLLQDRLIRESQRGYEITEEGRDALAELNAGDDFIGHTPSVQVFGMRAAG